MVGFLEKHQTDFLSSCRHDCSMFVGLEPYAQQVLGLPFSLQEVYPQQKARSSELLN